MTQVAVIKGKDRYQNVLSALETLEDEIKPNIKNKKILIKPNMLSVYHQPAASHRDSLRAITKFIKRFSPKEIAIAEGGCFGVRRIQDVFTGFNRYGYLDLRKKIPEIRFIDLNRDKHVRTKFLNIKHQEIEAKISKTAVGDWYRISLAKPKTSDFCIVTLSIKNMIGCLQGYDKMKIHGFSTSRMKEMIRHYSKKILPRVNPYPFPLYGFKNEQFAECCRILNKNIVRLVKVVPPSLSVIDGFDGMEGNGPLHGKLVRLRVAVASADYVAADAVMAKIMGFEPFDVGYIYYAYEEGLGEADLSAIEIKGAKIEDVAAKFKPHANYRYQLKWKE